MTPFFSIILPTYNRKLFLTQTISSVLKQTFKDWELIIIDDGSTDNTKELVNSYVENNSNIKYFYQTNKERSVARNNGIKKASGEYICFLDSDDEYLPNHLDTLKNAISNSSNKVAMFFTQNLVRKNNTKIQPSSKLFITYPNPATFFLRNPVIPARVCIHNSIFNYFKFDPNINMCEDTILWLSLSNRFKVVEILKETIVYNLHNENSVQLSSNNYERTLLNLTSFFKKEPEIFNKIETAVIKEVFSDLYFGMFKYNLSIGQNFRSLKYLAKSLIQDVWHPQTKFRLNLLLRVLFRMNIEKML